MSQVNLSLTKDTLSLRPAIHAAFLMLTPTSITHSHLLPSWPEHGQMQVWVRMFLLHIQKPWEEVGDGRRALWHPALGFRTVPRLCPPGDGLCPQPQSPFGIKITTLPGITFRKQGTSVEREGIFCRSTPPCSRLPWLHWPPFCHMLMCEPVTGKENRIPMMPSVQSGPPSWNADEARLSWGTEDTSTEQGPAEEEGGTQSVGHTMSQMSSALGICKATTEILRVLRSLASPKRLAIV